MNRRDRRTAILLALILICQIHQSYIMHLWRFEKISYVCDTDADCERKCIEAGGKPEECAIDAEEVQPSK